MNVLTELQQKALRAFFSVPELKRHFYLTGGTALSGFYLMHRFSDDLDLFTHSIEIDDIERIAIDAWKNFGLHPVKERGSPTYRRFLLNDGLQVDLVKDIDFRVGTPQLHQSFMVDNPKNIAVNKVTAIYGRFEPKDYVDLYFLKAYLSYNILELLKLGMQKDGGLEPFHWARIIKDVENITVLPRMLKPLELTELKKFFMNFREEIIDSLKPKNSTS
ncbi:MAG: nucleotidyl transferase AbiEii/AbiGii toxin family protein [Chlamydiae bacterium]|nr:nucleotidyl transferase AbiEii/AbiGii toxin family protein [Chlamydiota bacterium]